MQLRHTYREFSLKNRVFKGEAWVNSQGETTQFAKEYADKNPAELKADVEALKKAVQEKTADALDLEKLRIVEGVGKIVQEGKRFPTDQVNGTYVLDQNEAGQGLIALIKDKFPQYLTTTAITQLAYKWMIGQDSGVNFVKTGDKVTFEKGFLSVERDGVQVLTHVEILPINVLLGQNTESPAPAEPIETKPTTPPTEAPAPTEPTPAEEPTEPIQPPAATPAAPAKEPEALSERDAALQKAWEVEKQVLIQTAIDGGVTLDIKDEGPHGNNKDITVLKDGEPVGHIEVTVPPFVETYIYDRNNNFNIFTRTAKGRREISQDPEAGLRMIIEDLNPSTTIEKRSITDKKLARLTEKYERKFGLGIAEVRVEVDQQLQGISGVEGKIKEYLENKNGDYDILLIKEGGETTVIQVRHGGKEDEGSITLKGSGKTFRDIDEAIGAVRGLAKELAATPITIPSEPGDKPPAAEEKQEKPIATNETKLPSWAPALASELQTWPEKIQQELAADGVDLKLTDVKVSQTPEGVVMQFDANTTVTFEVKGAKKDFDGVLGTSEKPRYDSLIVHINRNGEGQSFKLSSDGSSQAEIDPMRSIFKELYPKEFKEKTHILQLAQDFKYLLSASDSRLGRTYLKADFMDYLDYLAARPEDMMNLPTAAIQTEVLTHSPDTDVAQKAKQVLEELKPKLTSLAQQESLSPESKRKVLELIAKLYPQN